MKNTGFEGPKVKSADLGVGGGKMTLTVDHEGLGGGWRGLGSSLVGLHDWL